MNLQQYAKGRQASPYKSISPGMRKEADARLNFIQKEILYSGNYFNIPVGASTQNIQVPGNAREIIGFFASFDDATTAGFNISVTISLNNESIYDAVDLQAFSVKTLMFEPGYLPVRKAVQGTDKLQINFNNGTAVAVVPANFVIVYK